MGGVGKVKELGEIVDKINLVELPSPLLLLLFLSLFFSFFFSLLLRSYYFFPFLFPLLSLLPPSLFFSSFPPPPSPSYLPLTMFSLFQISKLVSLMVYMAH